MYGDSCTAQKVEDGPETSTSFGMKVEPPGLPCRNDVLVENGDASPKSCLSPVKMRKSTPAGGLLHAGSAFTIKAQGDNFPPSSLELPRDERGEEYWYNKIDVRQVNPFLAPKGDRNKIKAKSGF